MKLSNTTISILENLAKINPAMMIDEGNVIRTKNKSNTMIVKAVLEDHFPRTFGVYDLGGFLQSLALFKEPEIEFKEKYLFVSEGVNKLKLGYADKLLIPEVRNEDVKIPENVWSVSFHLTPDVLKQIMKSSSALSLPNISFIPEGIIISDKRLDAGGSEVSNSFKIDIDYKKSGDVPDDFSVDLRVDSLIFLPKNYSVTVSGKRRVEFRSDDGSLIYWIVADTTSRT